MPPASVPTATSSSSLPPSSVPPSSPPPRSSSQTLSQTGSKRPSADIEPDSDHDTVVKKRRVMTQFHAASTGMKTPENPWRDWGRMCARVVDVFTDPAVIVQTYLKSILPAHDPATFTAQQKGWLQSYKKLVDHIPALGEYIIDCNHPSKLKELYKEMKAGQDSACNSDTNGLKTNIIRMIFHKDRMAQAASGLDDKVKTNRGFHNETTGNLLCPVDMDWNDATTKQKLRECPNKASTTSWPVFFYPKGQYDSEDILKGVLQSEILVYAYKYIYTGPSSWDKEDGVARNTRAGNATNALMYSVTSRSVTYIAAMVRFAMSSSSMNQKVGGLFDLSQFFWNVVKFLEDPDFEEEVVALMTWWNARIFPGASKDAATGDEPVSDSLAVLKAQKAARRVALGNATNQAVIPPQ